MTLVGLCASPHRGLALNPGRQPRGHVEVTVSISASGAVGFYWEAERPGELRPSAPAPDPLPLLLAELTASGYEAAHARPQGAGGDVEVFTAGARHEAGRGGDSGGGAGGSPFFTGTMPVALAHEDSQVTWHSRSYLVATVHRVEIRLKPGDGLLSVLAPPGSPAALPTFALFLQVPGRVFRSSAEARSVDGLYWAWDPAASPFIDAQAETVELHSMPAGLAALAIIVLFVSTAWAAAEARSSRRAKHRRRRGGGRPATTPREIT